MSADAPEGCTGNVWSALTGGHPGFDVAPEPGYRFGTDRPIDGPGMGALIGAAFDGCRPCQVRWLDALQSDPLTTTRLVELAAVSVHGTLGGVPDRMTATGPSSLSEPFRALVRAGVDAGDNHRPMFAAAQQLDDAGRRAALNDAVDMLVGYMTMGGL